MLITSLRLFRMAWSIAIGQPFDVHNIELLIADAHKTLAEFGTPGDDLRQMLDGPFTDGQARKEMQLQAIQRTIRYLHRSSPFYQKRFDFSDAHIQTLTLEDIHLLPLTRKEDLQLYSTEFLISTAHPAIKTRTTGTTGRPLEIWLSRYELELWSSLVALGSLLQADITPHDWVQINMSSRAVLATQLNLNICRLCNTPTSVLGLIDADESLDALLDNGYGTPTILLTYPSYLAQLLKAAQCRKLTAQDFRLRRISCASEVLSQSLRLAAEDTFGATVTDIVSMTETAPVTARVCSQGHLHHDLTTGFTEVMSLETGRPALPGEIGTLVVTPYYPYRVCMPVFRYDTRDVVRCLSDAPLTCEFSGMPATSLILGKADHLLRIKDHVISLRDLVEVIEAFPSQPWPARFNARVVDDSIEVTLPATTLEGCSEDEILQRFLQAGIPVTLLISTETVPVFSQFRPVRADLREVTFSTRSR